MKNVGIVYHDLYAKHDTGSHPERKDRVLHTIAQLSEQQMYGDARLAHFKPIAPRAATIPQLEWGHERQFISHVKEVVEKTKMLQYQSHLDGDTVVSPDSYDAALYAAGGNFAGIDAIFKGEIDRSFVLCRPPGHHSNAGLARGFCIFNNIVLATHYLVKEKNLQRVAIVDFDAHAGNGSEDMLYDGLDQGEVLLISTHQHPRTLYPGTCYIDEIGSGTQKGKIMNVTFAPGSGQVSVEKAFRDIINPVLGEFKPEFILCSAGFDAHHEDPLTNMGFQDQTYGWMLQEIIKAAEINAKGRIQCTLEGGYNLNAIGNSISNVINVLAGGSMPFTDDEFDEDKNVTEFTENKLIPELKKLFTPFWSSIKG